MTRETFFEIVSTGTLVVAGILLMNPFHLWMPTMVHMAVLVVVIVAVGIPAVFVVREREGDEREDAHRMFAGRAAYLAGSGILLSGIVVQSLGEQLDPWLVIALLATVLTKVAAHVYSARWR